MEISEAYSKKIEELRQVRVSLDAKVRKALNQFSIGVKLSFPNGNVLQCIEVCKGMKKAETYHVAPNDYHGWECTLQGTGWTDRDGLLFIATFDYSQIDEDDYDLETISNDVFVKFNNNQLQMLKPMDDEKYFELIEMLPQVFRNKIDVANDRIQRLNNLSNLVEGINENN